MAASAGQILLPIARAAIGSALGQPLAAAEQADWLQRSGACFVTLMQNGRLRGCIGTLTARRTLLADVKANAVAAALHDPRFTALTAAELQYTDIEISLLSAMQPLAFSSEAEALAQLIPGSDGLTFECGHHRGTFLPQVWEQLPNAREFMAHLKLKCGLPAEFWSNEIKLYRYTVQKFCERNAPPQIHDARAGAIK